MSTNPIPTGNGTLTRAIYLASLPVAVAELYAGVPTGTFANIPYAWLVTPGTIYNTAAGIAQAKAMLAAAQATGWPIDQYIQIWYNDPEESMQDRANQGYAYVPPYGAANITVGPGLPPPAGDVSNYPSTMPAGWIKVSTNAADYPPQPTASAPTQPAVYSTVGPFYASAVGSDGLLHYYWELVSGQTPTLGAPCAAEGLNFVAADFPGGNQGPIGNGEPMLMWMMVTAPTPSA